MAKDDGIERTRLRLNRIRIAAASGIVILLVTTAARMTISALYSQTTIWDNHFSVVISASTDGLQIEGLVSKHTSVVHLSLIDDVILLPVASIPSRLIAEDPRFDRFMAGVGGYFESRSGEVVYVKSDRPPWILLLRLLSDGFKLGDVSMPARSRLQILIAIGSLIAIFGYAFYRRGDASLFIAMIPVTLLALQGGTWGVVVAALIAAFWGVSAPSLGRILSAILQGKFGRTSKPPVAHFIVVCVSAALLLPLHPRPGVALLSFALTILGLFGCSLVAAALQFSIDGRREHNIFSPLHLIVRSIRPSRPITLALVAALIVIALLAAIAEIRDRSDMPGPAFVSGVKTFEWDDLFDLYHGGERRDIPGIADYLAHVAYQSYVHVSRDYRFPARGDTISLSTFHIDGERVVKTEKEVGRFDSVWYATQLSLARDMPLTALLLDQSRPVVAKRFEAPSAGRLVTLASIAAALALISIYASTIGAGLTAAANYGIRELWLRRKRQDSDSAILLDNA